MHAPKEAEKDQLFLTIAVAVILAGVCGAVFKLSGPGGLTYLRLNQNQTVAIGKVEGVAGQQVTYSFVGPDAVTRSKTMVIGREEQTSFKPGSAVRVLYNFDHPEHFVAERNLGGVKINFYFVVGALTVTLLAIVASLNAWVRYFRMKKREEYY